MALSKLQIANVCLIGKGWRECRYLDESFDGSSRCYLCKKLSPPEKKIIDEEVSDYMNDCIKSQKDPKAENYPLQINCQGYLPLKQKPQGYDV